MQFWTDALFVEVRNVLWKVRFLLSSFKTLYNAKYLQKVGKLATWELENNVGTTHFSYVHTNLVPRVEEDPGNEVVFTRTNFRPAEKVTGYSVYTGPFNISTLQFTRTFLRLDVWVFVRLRWFGAKKIPNACMNFLNRSKIQALSCEYTLTVFFIFHLNQYFMVIVHSSCHGYLNPTCIWIHQDLFQARHRVITAHLGNARVQSSTN